MPTTIKTALLVGASGLVGHELVNIILENPDYETLTILVRKRMDVEHPKLVQIEVDFNRLEAYKDFFSVTDVFCCLGTTIKKAGSQAAFRKVDFEYPLVMANLAKEQGAQKFLMITAIGADAHSKVFYSRVKGEIEQEIKQLGLASVHFFQPSLLLGNRSEFRLGEKLAMIVSPIFGILMVGSLRKYKPVKAKEVAMAMQIIAQRPLTGTFTYQSDSIIDLSQQEKPHA
mgnify:CR=1 FL=1